MIRYTVFSRVREVERRSKRVYVSGIGYEAIFREVDLGYYVWLEDSHESLHVGFDDPIFKPGDKVKITFEKIET